MGSTGVFYWVLKSLVRMALKAYFKKIHWLDAHKIPEQGPLLISANHPMAFADACLLACFMPRPIYFMVRGDVFVKKWEWFFKATNQIPIYRFRDGFENLRKNAQSMQEAEKVLVSGKALLMFPEGNTKLQLHLAPLQKGIARIALSAFSKMDKEDLNILPVGISYLKGTKFGSEVFIRFDKAISMKSFFASQPESGDLKTQALQLTSLLEAKMKPLVLHIEDHKWEKNIEKSLTEAGRVRQGIFQIVEKNPSTFDKNKNLIRKLEDNSYRVEHSIAKAPSPFHDPFKVLILVLFAPIGIFGILWHLLPFTLARWIANKRVKKPEFYTPVRVGVWLILFLLYAFLLLVFFLIFWQFEGLLVFASLLIISFLSKYYLNLVNY